MRALLLAAVLAGCGGEAARAPLDPATCQVWVTPPSYPPFLWTCTSGHATTPPQLPCVEDPLVVAPVAADGAYRVPSCATCTPAELLKLQPSARCSIGGNDPGWRYASDGGVDLSL